MSESQPPINQLVVRVYGLQRSGNHAMIDWIMQQYAGHPTLLLNNVRHGLEDPYLTCDRRVPHELGTADSPEALRAAPKALLVYSYEDARGRMTSDIAFLDSVLAVEATELEARFLGSSARTLDVMVVRDPFNFFASRLKRLDTLTGRRDTELIVRDWKQLATRAARTPANESATEVVGNYNRWARERDYRVWLGAKVGGRYSDASMKKVAEFGGGSSFEKQLEPLRAGDFVRKWRKALDLSRYRNIGHYLRRLRVPPATKMKVTERWLQSRADPTFRDIFLDPEILELSEHLFGRIDGAREWCQSLRSR